MRLRLRSDVPLAFCLSGGVDSSSLASIAAKRFGHEVAAFSIIDSDERYNEYDNIMATVRDIDCKHTVVKLKPGGMLEQLQELVAYHDAPVATITYLVHSFLIRFMAQQGYKVTFSGTAADELFTGYFDHWMWHLAEMKGNSNKLKEWQKHIKPLVRNPLLQNPQRFIDDATLRDHIYLDCDEFASYLRVDWQEGFAEEKYTESVLRNRMLNELFHEGTRLILHEDDLNSMMYSIENRSPYLDKNLFEVAYSIPIEHLMKDGYSKYPLRAAMKGVLNDKVRLDRHKKGFNASIHSIVDMNNPKDREYILADGPIYDLVDKSKIEGLMKRDYMSNSFSKFFFNFLSAKIFLELQSGQLKREGLVKSRLEASV
jgi:asparagine synthase (glutamine-hydrolysing)